MCGMPGDWGGLARTLVYCSDGWESGPDMGWARGQPDYMHYKLLYGQINYKHCMIRLKNIHM